MLFLLLGMICLFFFFPSSFFFNFGKTYLTYHGQKSLVGYSPWGRRVMHAMPRIPNIKFTTLTIFKCRVQWEVYSHCCDDLPCEIPENSAWI